MLVEVWSLFDAAAGVEEGGGGGEVGRSTSGLSRIRSWNKVSAVDGEWARERRACAG